MINNDYVTPQRCPVCGGQASVNTDQNTANLVVDCPSCGEYESTRALLQDRFETAEGTFDLNELAAYLFYNNGKNKLPVLLSQNYKDKNKFCISPKIVHNWYPKLFSEKVDMILLKLSELSKFNGDFVDASKFIVPLTFCVNKESSGINKGSELDVQINYAMDFLDAQGYVRWLGSYVYQLLPKGLERVYELQKTQTLNKNVFVSMAFNDGTKETREAIRQGIIDGGHSPAYIDEIIHNHQIVPEMFRLIRESRFLVLEISDPNYGAYYEAGYALGLGKEVIICCSEEVFLKEYTTAEEKKYAKYLKPHFDIAQKQILVWKDYKDLTKKLSEWIKALF